MRGAEDLEVVKDSQVRDADIEYISKHNLTTVLRETMEALLIHRPLAPIPFMIDCFSMGPRLASQDPDLGIAVWRKEELQRCFAYITEDKGRLDTFALKGYVSRGGHNVMDDGEIKELFESWKLQEDDCVTEHQFLQVFAVMSGDLKDDAFRLLVEELLT